MPEKYVWVKWSAAWGFDERGRPEPAGCTLFDQPGGKWTKVLLEEGTKCPPPDGHVWVRTITDELPWADYDWGVAVPASAVHDAPYAD